MRTSLPSVLKPQYCATPLLGTTELLPTSVDSWSSILCSSLCPSSTTLVFPAHTVWSPQALSPVPVGLEHLPHLPPHPATLTIKAQPRSPLPQGNLLCSWVGASAAPLNLA